MKILITGVNGFAGKVLYKYLSQQHEAAGIYNSGKAMFGNCFKVDLTKEAETIQVIGKAGGGSIDAIVHLASQTANTGNVNDLSVLFNNAAISKNIALAAREYAVKQFVNLSSSSVYPNIDGVFHENSSINPALNSDGIYGLSKYNSEVILDYFLSKTEIEITHLRTAMIIGEEMESTRLIPVIENEIVEHNTVTLFGKGERLLNLIRVEKLAEYVSFFLSHPSHNIVNIAEECLSVFDLAKRIIVQKGNAETKIILKEEGNRSKFILDIQKLKKIMANSVNHGEK